MACIVMALYSHMACAGMAYTVMACIPRDGAGLRRLVVVERRVVLVLQENLLHHLQLGLVCVDEEPAAAIGTCIDMRTDMHTNVRWGCVLRTVGKALCRGHNYVGHN